MDCDYEEAVQMRVHWGTIDKHLWGTFYCVARYNRIETDHRYWTHQLCWYSSICSGNPHCKYNFTSAGQLIVCWGALDWLPDIGLKIDGLTFVEQSNAAPITNAPLMILTHLQQQSLHLFMPIEAWTWRNFYNLWAFYSFHVLCEIDKDNLTLDHGAVPLSSDPVFSFCGGSPPPGLYLSWFLQCNLPWLLNLAVVSRW